MENDKLLWDIESELEIFQAHIKRMRKNPGQIHLLDVDLLQDKTRKLYDKLQQLTESFSNEEKQDLSEKLKEEKLPIEHTSEKQNPPKEELEEETTIEVSKPEQVTLEEEKHEESFSIPENEISEQIPNDEPEPVEEETDEKLFINKDETGLATEQVAEKVPQDKPEPNEPKVVKSTIDLFSDTAEETIADKFGSRDDSSIAKKMQQQSIGDLRQAIGINEKFLFINGLFNGDLGRYNKAIDEFNELSTKEGVNAHFLELKIHNQWADDNEGVKKLKSLLDRKFN